MSIVHVRTWVETQKNHANTNTETRWYERYKQIQDHNN